MLISQRGDLGGLQGTNYRDASLIKLNVEQWQADASCQYSVPPAPVDRSKGSTSKHPPWLAVSDIPVMAVSSDLCSHRISHRAVKTGLAGLAGWAKESQVLYLSSYIAFAFAIDMYLAAYVQVHNRLLCTHCGALPVLWSP